MTKKLKEIKAGSLVAFNTLDDAAWFEVIERDGFHLKIREAGTDYRMQFSDVSLVRQVQ